MEELQRVWRLAVISAADHKGLQRVVPAIGAELMHAAGCP